MKQAACIKAHVGRSALNHKCGSKLKMQLKTLRLLLDTRCFEMQFVTLPSSRLSKKVPELLLSYHRNPTY
jgi:hypothetical protein